MASTFPIPGPLAVPAPGDPGEAQPAGRGAMSLRQRLQRRVRQRVLSPLDTRVGGALRAQVNAGRVYRPIFVAGAMGSGTTLLGLSLWQHFDIAAVIRESLHEIAPSSFLHGHKPQHFPSVRAYEESLLPRANWPVEPGRAALLAMYRRNAWGWSDVALDKGPNGNLVRASFLARCFPEGRFVLIFRDPVATVEGFRRKWEPFHSESLAESIRFCRSIHERFLEAMWEFPERVFALRYESLVAKHDEALALLGEALDLAPSRRARRLEARPNFEGCGIRNVQDGRIGIVTDANRSSYERLDRHEVAQIHDELGPLYERMNLAAAI